MNAADLGKLILQNIKVSDPNDAIFELKQLADLTKKDFSKEIKSLKIPNVAGRPEILHKVTSQFKQDFPVYQKSKLSADNIGRYEPRKEE